VDLPGFGGSPALTGALTVDSAADAVAEFLNHAGVSERAIVGGLSMGGYVAMAFARRHAGRLAGLILADTKSDPDDQAGKQNREKMIDVAKEKGAEGVIEQMLPKALGDDTRSNRPEVVERVRAIASRQSTEGVLNAIAALRDRPDATPGLAVIGVPTLIIVGDQDAITPPQAAAAMATRISGSRLVTIPGVGHLSNLEDPAAFNAAVMAFLQRSDVRSRASKV
jgi:pimeloyl-ACP methyl ester carboxylesterase